jgi:predicted transcriptional regulator
VWTEEMTAICYGMKRAGMTNRAIADRLGVTPVQVAEKCQHKAHQSLTGKGSRYRAKGRITASTPPSNLMEDL